MERMQDLDPVETGEWVDSLRAVRQHAGPERAKYLLGMLRDEALRTGTMPPFLATTPYRNTIPPDQEVRNPGNIEIEERRSVMIHLQARPIDHGQLIDRAEDFINRAASGAHAHDFPVLIAPQRPDLKGVSRDA